MTEVCVTPTPGQRAQSLMCTRKNRSQTKRKTPDRKVVTWMTVGRRGPLPKLITQTEMRLLGAQLCTLGEAAAALGMARSVLFERLRDNPKLREAWEQGQQRSHASLRQRQLEIALSPDHPGAVQMLIHLGRTVLGQTQKPQPTVTGAIKIAEIRRVIVSAADSPETAGHIDLVGGAPNGHLLGSSINRHDGALSGNGPVIEDSQPTRDDQGR
jgi:hypothetical protein